jgi:hypothetical protein
MVMGGIFKEGATVSIKKLCCIGRSVLSDSPSTQAEYKEEVRVCVYPQLLQSQIVALLAQGFGSMNQIDAFGFHSLMGLQTVSFKKNPVCLTKFLFLYSLQLQ